MQVKHVFAVILSAVFLGISCNKPVAPDLEQEVPLETTEQVSEEEKAESYSPTELSEGSLIKPDNFTYLGFFRLPEPSGGSDWDYSGHGLTYFPDGDPEGEKDSFPGSLFGFGHDHHLMVSEITIPAPVVTDNLEDANTAQTLQPFSDLTGGIFSPLDMTIPRAGIEYLAEPSPRLHFTFGQHFQDFEASHGWAELDLTRPNASGPWVFGEFTNYVTNDYLFEIPSNWGAAIAPGPLLASGRAREGLWSGRGPALFAYKPGNLDQPPSPGDTISEVIPLLLYGEQISGLPDIVSSPEQAEDNYHEGDHWWGGAWINTRDASSVIFVGTKALGDEWYGFANGVVWEHDCAESDPPTCPDPPEWPFDNRGFWAEDYQAQIIFYNPEDLVKVAQGKLASWEPQPYAVLVLDDYLLDPEINHQEYKRDLVGGVAYDRENGYLYLIERLADEYRSVIHVWSVQG